MRRATLTLLATIIVLSGIGSAGPVPARAGATLVTRRVSEAAAARKFWTPERMRAARPLTLRVSDRRETRSLARAARPSGAPGYVEPSAPAEPSAPKTKAGEAAAGPIPYTRSEVTDYLTYPNTTHGKVFMLDSAGNMWVCSGTAINAANLSVVWTAGHCVHEGASGDFMQAIIFVPGYHDGTAPLGEWAALEMHTTAQWASSTNFGYDYGALVVEPHGDERLVQAVGGRGFAFNLPSEQSFQAFGHPHAPPFDGERLFVCSSAVGWVDPTETPNPLAVGCDMTQGSSGGGWVIAGGYVNSNVSYGYLEEPEVLYGPYLDSSAATLLNTAASSTAPGPLPNPVPDPGETIEPTPDPGGTPEPEPTPTPDPDPDPGPAERVVSLKLKGNLRATGKITSGAPQCVRNARVEIQRRKNGVWKDIRTTRSDHKGAYSKKLRDRRGAYRAVLNATPHCSLSLSKIKRN